MSSKRLRIAVNGHRHYRVEVEQPIPGDLDGGTVWVAYDDIRCADLRQAQDRLRDIEAEEHERSLADTWEPIG